MYKFIIKIIILIIFNSNILPQEIVVSSISEGISIIKIKNKESFDYYVQSEDGNLKLIEGIENIKKGRWGSIKFFKFSDGLAKFTSPKNLYHREGGFINGEGKIVFKYSDGPYKSFSEGLSVKEQQSFSNRKLDYIDKTGKIILSGYYGADSFSHGLAPVSKVGRNSAVLDEVPIFTHLKWGFINKKNKFIIKPIYDDAKSFSKEGVAFIKKNGQWKVLRNSDGKREFNLLIGGKWGLIDLKGKVILNYTFDDVKDFSEGIAPVLIDSKQNYKLDYIAPEGRPFGYIENIGGKWGFIDSNGKIVIEPKFEEANSFENGIAEIKINGEILKIDLKGNFIK